MVSRKQLIVIGIVAGIGVVILIIIAILSNLGPKKAPDESGGSGKPEMGTVILTGLETKDPSGVTVGEITSTTIQSNIRALLKSNLSSKKSLSTYAAHVVQGSFKIDYNTNQVTYNVQSDDPAATYTVTFDTMSDGSLQVTEAGQLLDLD